MIAATEQNQLLIRWLSSEQGLVLFRRRIGVPTQGGPDDIC